MLTKLYYVIDMYFRYISIHFSLISSLLNNSCIYKLLNYYDTAFYFIFIFHCTI